MKETFRSFLEEMNEPFSGKDLLEAEVIGIMQKEGFSDKQIYDMPLKKLLDLFYGAYLWKATSILSKATVEAFLKKLRYVLI